MAGYAVIIEEAEHGFGASCPDLPGCTALGDTYEECLAEIRRQIRTHVQEQRNGADRAPTDAPS